MVKLLQNAEIFMKLLLAANSDQRTVIAVDNDKTMAESPMGKKIEDAKPGNLQTRSEHQDLETLRNPDVYEHTEEYPDDECYCVIAEKHLKLLSGLERTELDSGKEGKAVVRLERLFGSENPRKWLDWVIFYSSGKKTLKMEKREFLGTAIYAQRYIAANTNREKILFDNLFDLFLGNAILSKIMIKNSTFYSDIHAIDIDENDERGMLLLEDFMKTVLKKVLVGLGIEFSIDKEDLNIYPSDRDCDINDYCDKRDDLKVTNKDSTAASFKNVIMKRVPPIKSRRFGCILLTLIGMIRSGKHVISARCGDWVPRDHKEENYARRGYGLMDAISLVDTNRNLVGITEFINSADMDNVNELLGDVKEQLRYFEFQLGGGDNKVAKMAEFIEGLSDVELKVAVYDPLPAINKWLLNVQQASNIKNLSIKIIDASYYQDALKSLLESENVRRLELFCYDMTLEKFLMGIYKPLTTGEGKSSNVNLRSKLKTLAVTNLGNLSSEMISDELLGDLGLERLLVSIDHKKDIDLSNLVKRGITTGDRLRYLVIASVSEKNIQSAVDLKRLMGGGREWPVLLTNYQQIWTFDCVRTSSYYEVVDPESIRD